MLAPLHLVADRLGEGRPWPRPCSPARRPWAPARPAGRRPLPGPAAARRRGSNGGGSALGAEALQVEVVDHLDHQVVEVLDQLGARVGVAGDAERAQHELAELVGGRDRRAVEAGQRVGDPLVAQRRRRRSPGGSGVRRPGVTVDGIGQRALGGDQLLAHPLAQLLAGRAAEGDHQHLVEGGDPLGDVARHQRTDRERLAGAGAGLEDGRGPRLGQGTEDVEGRRVVGSSVIASPARASGATAAWPGRRAGWSRRRTPRPGAAHRAARRAERRRPTRRRGRRRRSRRGTCSTAT